MNLAAVWKLPAIYFFVNNQYGEFTPIAESTAVTCIAKRAAAYDMPGVTVDGNDIEAVYDAASEAVARAREGKGPTLLECLTYRHHGHFHGEEAMLGTQAYRDKAEIDKWKDVCPIARFTKKITDAGVLTVDDAEKLRAEAQSEVDAAVEFAKKSPLPKPEAALEDVYAPAHA